MFTVEIFPQIIPVCMPWTRTNHLPACKTELGLRTTCCGVGWLKMLQGNAVALLVLFCSIRRNSRSVAVHVSTTNFKIYYLKYAFCPIHVSQNHPPACSETRREYFMNIPYSTLLTSTEKLIADAIESLGMLCSLHPILSAPEIFSRRLNAYPCMWVCVCSDSFSASSNPSRGNSSFLLTVCMQWQTIMMDFPLVFMNLCMRVFM